MNHIDVFFSKLKSTFANQTGKKEIISSACLRHSAVDAGASQIEIHGRVVRLNISPAAKSAIFLKKTAILDDINQKIKPTLIDIR
ncbi:MAG: hypothetical protein AAB635_00665 [Patescibacteria group bacterium]